MPKRAGGTCAQGNRGPERTAAMPAPGVLMCHGFTGHRIEAHFVFVKGARALCVENIL